jgi:hypothetical protein
MAPPTPHWTERLLTFDRRWIFLAMSLAIVVPLIFPIRMPVKASPMTRSAYHTIEELSPGDTVFISLDLDPAATPELEPYVRAVLIQLKSKGVKLVFATTWPKAPPLIERWLREMLDEPLAPEGTPDFAGPYDRAYKKNVDYVWLGFREGQHVAISQFGSDLRAIFDQRAADGTPLAEIPMMSGIKRLKDFKLIVLVGAGFPGIKEYMQLVQSRYKLRVVGATTAVQTTDLTPYYQAGQLLGLVGGLAAVAEYEALVGKPGLATSAADVLNVTHGLVIVAILFGNFIYFAGRHRRRRAGR